MEKLYVGFEMANKWTDPPMVIMYLAFGGIPGMIYTTYKFACWFGIYGLPVPALALVAWYFLVWHAPEPSEWRRGCGALAHPRIPAHPQRARGLGGMGRHMALQPFPPAPYLSAIMHHMCPLPYVWYFSTSDASTAMDNGEHKYLIFKDEGLKSKYNAVSLIQRRGLQGT